MRNAEVAKLLYAIADILEVQEVKFKPAAYRRAAHEIETLSEDIELIWKRGELDEIPAVGKHIAEKISEYLDTGKLGYFEKLKKQAPFDIQGLGEIEGIGPKTAKKLYEKLKIRSVSDLEDAIRKHEVSKLEGFGESSEQRIHESLESMKRRGNRIPLGRISQTANSIIGRITQLNIGKVEIVGSFRRRCETIGDLDVLVDSTEPKTVMDFFCSMPEVVRVLSRGTTKSSIEFTDGLHVDLRVVKPESFGSALQYFTGSKEHNVATRRIAIRKGMKLNEYGLFKGKNKLGGKSENELYRLLGMQYVPPELREDSGEIEAALSGSLPKLLLQDDILGDLHVHTNWSEGQNSISEMAQKGKSLGYSYMAISDHGGRLPIANSLDEKRISKQGKEIERLNKIGASEGWPRLLKGSEVNIVRNGLDVPDYILKELDIVIAGVHGGMHNSREKMMKRIFSAMENEHVDIIAHPTGRIIGKREPYELDMDMLIDKAAETGTILEINSQPDRMDLKDSHIRLAKGRTMIAINTDAHGDSQMDYMWLGVANARRGWAEKKDIVNTLSLKQLSKLIGF